MIQMPRVVDLEKYAKKSLKTDLMKKGREDIVIAEEGIVEKFKKFFRESSNKNLVVL